MFMGEFQHSIDSKGRIIIPAKFRSELGPKFVITRGMDGCLFGYPMTEWEKVQEKIDELPVSKKDSRAFTRFFFSAAVECELDKQGRINLPKTLVQYAKIIKKCVVVGVSNRFEIWSEELWEDFSTEAEENFNEIAENMIDF
ncbi:division/cell wall cluster transcriptional repressor MraZ [Lentilactobacillus senioris]|uniref:division/cell wall cluster transcriptional repressor MraZ n=1 Tax=Lentilactobacillus senioris TaxID=931534 RepID=UPI000A926DEF|nr:division/cell wall cluster transcriptional repressor MraZ [Lentilactobacillus senioris]